MDNMDYSSESSFGVKYKLRHFNKFRILVAVTVLLGLLLAIFIILFAVEKSLYDKVRGKNIDVGPCDTKDCLFASLDILNQLNQSADPCKDFFLYACGGYIDKNPLTIGMTSRSGFSDAADKNLQVLKKSLETASVKYSENEAVMKTVRFYNSCVDEDAVNAQGDNLLKDLIKKYGGWDVLGNITSNTRDPMELLADITRNLGIKPLISVKVVVAYHDSSSHIVQLRTGALGMSKTFYSSGSQENVRVQAAYKNYMKTIARLLGGSADSDKKMMEVYEFESKLAEIQMKEYPSSITETLEEVSLAAAAAGSSYDVRTSIRKFSNQTNTTTKLVINLLSAIFKDQKKTFTPDDLIVAVPVNYFKKVFELFNNQSKSDRKVIDNYIMWTLVNSFVLAMPSNYTDAWLQYQNVLIGKRTPDRSISCIRQMQRYFAMSMGFLFIESAFDEQSKKEIEEMGRYTKSAFLEKLKSNRWISYYTRSRAREKALAMKESIGYPPYIKNPNLLKADYSGLEVTGVLFKNVLALHKFNSKQSLSSLGKAVDKTKWVSSPSETNGYYSSQQNRIVFLAGILQPPFYNPSYPKYLNYGGIGMVIGHEITHGFDTIGAAFDKNGNFNGWWSAVSQAKFQKEAQCLKSQYSRYEVFGEYVNGNQTINENIADNGGIQLAYNAYHDWARENGAEKHLPGVGLTVDQLFFVGFAKAWCSIYTKEAALYQLRTDTHTFAKYRVIGSLSNFPKFSEAFKCKPGSPMNPVSKCSLW